MSTECSTDHSEFTLRVGCIVSSFYLQSVNCHFVLPSLALQSKAF